MVHSYAQSLPSFGLFTALDLPPEGALRTPQQVIAIFNEVYAMTSWAGVHGLLLSASHKGHAVTAVRSKLCNRNTLRCSLMLSCAI